MSQRGILNWNIKLPPLYLLHCHWRLGVSDQVAVLSLWPMLSSDPLVLSLSVSLQDSKLNLAGEKEKKKTGPPFFAPPTRRVKKASWINSLVVGLARCSVILLPVSMCHALLGMTWRICARLYSCWLIFHQGHGRSFFRPWRRLLRPTSKQCFLIHGICFVISGSMQPLRVRAPVIKVLYMNVDWLVLAFQNRLCIVPWPLINLANPLHCGLHCAFSWWNWVNCLVHLFSPAQKSCYLRRLSH